MRAILALLSVLLVFAISVQGQQINVGPNVQVSKGYQDRDHNEVILSADPYDARRLLGGAMVLDPKSSGYDVVTYVSLDGGQTWQPTPEVDRVAGDPATAF